MNLTETTITGHTRLTGLLGRPVAHSISPLMHNEAFRTLGIDSIYLCFDVGEEELSDAVRGLRQMNVQGFNLTMPNKNAIVPLLDELSPAASLIGAVNTVVNENGRLIGHNTDGAGFLRAASENGQSVREKTITLLGAGGAASAICAQAALDGASVIHLFLRSSSRFFSRTEKLAETVNATLPAKIILHEQGDEPALRRALSESSLLINGTSVGMAPHTDGCLIPDASYFHPALAVADVIYNPKETKLLALARSVGLTAFNGMYMLLYQGAEAFRLWTGQEMPVDRIKEKYFA